MSWWPSIQRRTIGIRRRSCQIECSQIDLRCLYLTRIESPDISWTVNKLARAITKWVRACDKRLVRLISCIHFTSEYNQCCHVGNTAQKNQNMTVSRFWHCRKSGRFEIDFRWNIVRVRKSHVCSNKLDVQETDMCVPQFNGCWNYFCGYGVTYGRNSRPRSLGFGYYCDALKLKSGAERQVSTKRSVTRQSIREATNSASHQTGTTRTFVSWALRMTQVKSLVHKTVILSPRCHVTPWYWWACFLVLLLHISFLFVFLFIRCRIESNSHCHSSQRRVWLADWISNTDHQSNIDLNHETDSTTIFEQMDNFQERASLSVSQQIPYQKSRSSSRKSAASTVPTMFASNRKSFWQRERDNVSQWSVFSHSTRSGNWSQDLCP